jgi:uncharacterized protein
MLLFKRETTTKYSKFLWVFFLAFPFIMQGFKPSELSAKAAHILPITAQLNFNNQAVQLEVARTDIARSHGLTYRESLPNDRGMLYQLSSLTYFTGRGMKFSTDLIFISAGKVVNIRQVQTCSEQETKCFEYQTHPTDDQVIELKAGIANKLGISVGNVLNVSYLPR